MQKQEAIRKLGGVMAAARAIGITHQAVRKWPEMLSPATTDRVEAALARVAAKAKKAPGA